MSDGWNGNEWMELLMSVYLDFRVCVPPRGKGRPRFTRTGHAYTDSSTRAYEQQVRNYAEAEARYANLPLGAPVEIEMTFIMPVPKSWPIWKKDKALCGELPHTKKFDLDNMIKANLDAFNGVLYTDDSHIVKLSASKRYGVNPRTEVSIRYLDENENGR